MTANKRNTQIDVILVLAFVIVVVFWLATPFLVEHFVGTQGFARQGQFGDLFGSINALFSGLAFFGVVAALSLQRKAMHAQNVEMAETKQIQQQTVDALVHTMYASSFSKVYDVLDDDAVISARHVVEGLEAIPYERWKEDAKWADNEKHVKTLLRAYNIAGIFVRHGFLPTKYLVPDWEPSLRSTWKTLAPYVQEQRTRRGSVNHWPNYEWLAKEAEAYVASVAQPIGQPDAAR